MNAYNFIRQILWNEITVCLPLACLQIPTVLKRRKRLVAEMNNTEIEDLKKHMLHDS